ncbi:MAG: 1-deoxy-D-xylulose-5-phosphate reductoisomerase [Bryobacteraceae bacterium]|nr:1-deoxy-D-xylulose-5-phosphate reductoisomerase [Bryobacteraceae bacterium]
MKLTVLGSTGSIGQSTLDVVRQNPDRFQIHALVAGRNLQTLCDQIQEFKPSVAVVAAEQDLPRLRELLDARGIHSPDLLWGSRAYIEVATAPESDFLMSSIVGVAGLEATFEAIRAGKRIGLANKETLVAAGALVMGEVKRRGVELIPVDSEHNGAHQCLRAGRRDEATKLILTASGGPFRKSTASEMSKVTPEQALNHPTWKMGPRITVDSATLMNKGFEVIEACWLFDFPVDQVEVVVHPQSTVHAMVEYNDGSVIAQVCATDMRMPIQYALTWPERAPAPVPRLQWSQARTWEFEPPDMERFPLLRLAYQAQSEGGSLTATLNAADEIAVEEFLAGRIGFPAIAEVVEETLSRVGRLEPKTIGDVLDIDRHSRETARIVAAEMGARSAVR